VTDHGDGNITFTPKPIDIPQAETEAKSENAGNTFRVAFNFFNEMDPVALGDTLKAGAVTFIVNGENVQTETAVFRITGEDGHTLTETTLDTLNNEDADEDGLFRILQLGVNDAPELGTLINSEEPGEVFVAIEAGETVYPFTQVFVSDIDSAYMQQLNIDPDPGGIDHVHLVTTDAAQAIIESYDVQITRDAQTGWTLMGTMPVEDFNSMIQGIGFENIDDNLQNTGTEAVTLNLTVLDVSETTFNDHLADATFASLSVVNTPEPIDPPTPIRHVPPPVEPAPVIPYRNIEEDEDRYLALLDPELPPDDPVNVHITLFVRGLDYQLEGQTDDVQHDRIIAKETQDLRTAIQDNGIDRFDQIVQLAHTVGAEDYTDTQEGRQQAASAYGVAQ